MRVAWLRVALAGEDERRAGGVSGADDDALGLLDELCVLAVFGEHLLVVGEVLGAAVEELGEGAVDGHDKVADAVGLAGGGVLSAEYGVRLAGPSRSEQVLVDVASSEEFFEDLLRVGGEPVLADEVAVLEHALLQLLLAVLVVDLLLLALVEMMVLSCRTSKAYAASANRW